MMTLVDALPVDGPASLADGPASADGLMLPDDKKGNGRMGCSNAGTCSAVVAMWVAVPGVPCPATETGSEKSCSCVIFSLSD